MDAAPAPSQPRSDPPQAAVTPPNGLPMAVVDMPMNAEIAELTTKVAAAGLPQDLRLKLEGMLIRLNRSSTSAGYLNQYEEMVSYVDWATSLPWQKRHPDQLDLRQAQEVLNRNHYGMVPIKRRILEFLSVLTLQSQAEDRSLITRTPVLCFVGLPGIGKTSVAASIAEALGRPFIRIPMGGMGSTIQLRGQSRNQPMAEPGQVIKSLRRVGVRNPVILLDEIDRTAESGRSEIMGVLLELLDPEQNNAFSDAYVDYPFNLSEVLFIASANNTNGIANAVLDRLEVVQMPGYSDDEKLHIAKDYLFPRQLKFANIPAAAVVVDDDVWPVIIRPLGFDAGIRTMERVINGLVRKLALQIVSGQAQQFHITTQNVKQFLPSW